MARKMYDVVYQKPDPKNPERKLEIPVGVAFSSDKSTTFRIRIDAIPLNFDGALLIRLNDPMSVIDE